MPENIYSSEDPSRAEAAQTAQEVLSELESKEGKKCFVLIVDDSAIKTEELKIALNQHARKDGVNYAVREVVTGIEGIGVYEAFAKLKSKYKVAIFMDGDLRPERGHEVTRDLFAIAGENNFPPPVIIATSGTPSANEAIGKACPQGVFLGSFVENADRANALAALDSRL